MLSREKVEKHLKEQYQDTNSELDRFIKELLIKIEFGAFEPEFEEEEDDDSNYAFKNF